jgi:hypothetical protein
MRRQVNELNATDGDGGPLFVVATVPDLPGKYGLLGADVCDDDRPDYAFERQHRAAVLATFAPFVVDSNCAVEEIDRALCYSDGVHFLGECAAAIGGAGSTRCPGIGLWMQGVNACVTGAGTRFQRPRYYCRDPNGTWDAQNDTCADCTAGQTCELKPCTTNGDCGASADTCMRDTGPL